MKNKFSRLYNKIRSLPALSTLRPSRRRFQRRSHDACVSLIDGMAYPIKDWSMGGVLIFGDPQAFSLNKTHQITLKFRVGSHVFEIPHTGSVIRKTAHNIALQFDPLTFETNHLFRSVIKQL